MKNLIYSIVIIFCISSCGKDEQVTPSRDKFFGTYTVVESCQSGNYNYDITISSSAENESTVLIGNFGNFKTSAKATVMNNIMTIPNQTLNIQGNSLTINSGTGSLNGNLLILSYGYSDGPMTENCSMNCTKK
jgi:hypothetical protein